MALSPRGWDMIRIVSVLVGLATLSAILRVIARIKIRMKFGIDDYLCFGGMVFLYGMLIELILWCAIGGNGTHIADLDPHTIENFSKIFLSNQFTYFVLCPCIKISIICFYRRIFSTTKFRVISSAIIALIATWATGIILACALQCRPLRGYWDKSIDAHCFDEDTFFIVNQVFNVIMDFVILGLPLPIIWGLKRAWQDKLALSGIFILGGFVCFASIYRIVVLFYINPNDPTYTVYQATLWTHVEACIGMICSCLPTIRGLFPTYRFGSLRTGKISKSGGFHGTSNLDSAHLASGSNIRNSVYIKMCDAVAYRTDSDEDVLMKSKLESDSKSAVGITVRTDIDIVGVSA